MQITRLFDILPYQLDNYPQETCLAWKEENEWKSYSTTEVIDAGNRLSCALLDYGIKPGDNVGIVSYNCPGWIISDYAILQIGAVTVPLYPNATTEDYRYIIDHAGITHLFVGDEEIREKVEEISGVRLINFNRKEFKDLLYHSEERIKELPALRDNVKRHDLASIIYTSGTTGRPKGVMLSHHNILSNVTSLTGILKEAGSGPGSRLLSFLPLCHIFERTGAYLDLQFGVSVYFAESMDKIGDNIREIKPHLIRSVPRLLEKIYEKIISKGYELRGIKKNLFFWAVSLAEQYDLQDKGSFTYRLKYAIADKLILSKWREALGGNIQLIFSGAASLRPSLITIFWAAKMPVLEGYGLTETSPVVSASRYDRSGIRVGCVGKPIEDVKVRIAEDGEILVKGPNVMMGYYRQPEATREVLTEDGWFHTGDIGEFVDDFLKITDRKKEMFKTSGGKYIAPQPMEIRLKESMYIEHAMVVGENEKFPAVLILPAREQLQGYCKRHKIEEMKESELLKHPEIIALYEREINKANESFARFEKVKQFRLVSGEWSVDSGLVTPTLKLKRKAIYGRYKNEVADIYTSLQEIP